MTWRKAGTDLRERRSRGKAQSGKESEVIGQYKPRYSGRASHKVVLHDTKIADMSHCGFGIQGGSSGSRL